MSGRARMCDRAAGWVLAAAVFCAAPAAAQSRGVEIGGFATVGQVHFAAERSIEAVLGAPDGTVIGGGGAVGLPWGGLFVAVGASRFSGKGERVFVSDGAVYPLGIPLEVTVTPIELTGGWRFRGLSRRVVPYAGGGLSWYRYRETSTFAAAGEDVDERYSGYHVVGGAEVRVTRWLGVAGEVVWATVPDALGEGGVSAEFDESDLGGRTVRLKITIGR